MTATQRSVIHFRRGILRWSETFIASQALAMRRYAPVFAGYKRVTDGIALIQGRPAILLTEQAMLSGIAWQLLKRGWYVPAGFRRALAETKPAVVHAHFGSGALPAYALSRALDVPLVVTYLGMDITVTPSAAEAARRRRAFEVADAVLTVSDFLADLVRKAGCPPEKVRTLYTGVDVERFQPGSAPPARAQVLYVGRLAAKKGVTHLLRAMPAVAAEVPDVELVIAGDGDLRASLEAEAHRLGVRARFLGIQTPDQVRALMQQATLLCGPSVVDARGNAEGLPFVFLEAQACGCPIVVSPSGGTAEGLEDGVTGIICPPGDEPALARAMLGILRDPARRAAMATAARARMVERFNLARQTALLEDLYDRLVAARGTRG